MHNIIGLDAISTPALLVDADLVAENIRRMLAAVEGQTHRLRPHVKTHKMSEVIRLYLDAGIDQFKAATLAEAEIVARAGGRDCLLAHQLVGPKIEQLFELIAAYPATAFSTIVDEPLTVQRLKNCAARQRRAVDVLIDVDCGMHRTGVPFGSQLTQLREQILAMEGVEYGGLHLYDGHLHQSSLEERTTAAQEILDSIREDLRQVPSPLVVVSGSPTFPFWARHCSAADAKRHDDSGTHWQCSPGTMVFWDHGYAENFPDMQYEIAAVLVTRVISKPGPGRVCLDLGHKSIASEMPLQQRAFFPDLPDARLVAHSEEHLVIESAAAGSLSVGDAVIVHPRHICPTVALYPYVTIVRDGRVTDQRWAVDGKNTYSLVNSRI